MGRAGIIEISNVRLTHEYVKHGFFQSGYAFKVDQVIKDSCLEEYLGLSLAELGLHI